MRLRSTKIEPRRVAREIASALRTRAEPRKARSLSRFFKHPVAPLGVSTEDIRRIVDRWAREVKPAWRAGDAATLCDLLVRKRALECRVAGILFLSKFSTTLGPSFLSQAESWLEHRASDWAVTDGIATMLVAPMLDAYPTLRRRVVGWTQARSPWTRRAAAVALVPHVRRGRFSGAAYDVARRLLSDRDDLVRKAVGWLLREAGKRDRDRLESFLLEHREKIPRVTVRHAIETYPESRRKRLLEATRA